MFKDRVTRDEARLELRFRTALARIVGDGIARLTPSQALNCLLLTEEDLGDELFAQVFVRGEHSLDGITLRGVKVERLA